MITPDSMKNFVLKHKSALHNAAAITLLISCLILVVLCTHIVGSTDHGTYFAIDVLYLTSMALSIATIGLTVEVLVLKTELLE
jgi:hypothetical protein